MAYFVKQYTSGFVTATAGQTITVGTPSSTIGGIYLPPGFDHADILVEEVSGASTLGFTTTGSTVNVYQGNSTSAVSLADGAIDDQTNLAIGTTGLFSAADCTAGRVGVVSAVERAAGGTVQALRSVAANRITLSLKRDATVGTGTYLVTVWVYAHQCEPAVPAPVAASAA